MARGQDVIRTNGRVAEYVQLSYDPALVSVVAYIGDHFLCNTKQTVPSPNLDLKDV